MHRTTATPSLLLVLLLALLLVLQPTKPVALLLGPRLGLRLSGTLAALQAPKPVALLPTLLLVLLLVLQRCRRKPLQQGLELVVLLKLAATTKRGVVWIPADVATAVRGPETGDQQGVTDGMLMVADLIKSAAPVLRSPNHNECR